MSRPSVHPRPSAAATTTTTTTTRTKTSSSAANSHCARLDFVRLPESSSGNSSRPALTTQALTEDVVFVFIHVNKAGGTLIKEDVMKPAALAHKWDGAGFGTVEVAALDPASCTNVVEGEGLACGKLTAVSACGPQGGGKCPLRTVWGSLAVGWCLSPTRTTKPCVQVIVLRHPLERLVSQYNYVCVEGKEGRKKWKSTWREEGRCPLTLEAFLNTQRLTTPSLLVKRLVGGDTANANSRCGLEQAKRNLMHPCMRFLLLDRLNDGLERLAATWGPLMEPFLRRVSHLPKRNASPYPQRTKVQADNEELMARINKLLELDLELYQYAMDRYEDQWSQNLQSCNEYV